MRPRPARLEETELAVTSSTLTLTLSVRLRRLLLSRLALKRPRKDAVNIGNLRQIVGLARWRNVFFFFFINSRDLNSK